MDIQRNASKPSAKGPTEYFTGSVHIDTPFQAREPARVDGAIVRFEPGVRTAWHTYPLGQILIVTSGLGWAMIVLDISIVITGLPDIREDFGFSAAGLS